MSKVRYSVLILLASLFSENANANCYSTSEYDYVSFKPYGHHNREYHKSRILSVYGGNGSASIVDKNNRIALTGDHVVRGLEERELLFPFEKFKIPYKVVYSNKEDDFSVLKLAGLPKSNESFEVSFSKLDIDEEYLASGYVPDKDFRFFNIPSIQGSSEKNKCEFAAGINLLDGMSGGPIIDKYSYEIVGVIKKNLGIYPETYFTSMKCISDALISERYYESSDEIAYNIGWVLKDDNYLPHPLSLTRLNNPNWISNLQLYLFQKNLANNINILEDIGVSQNNICSLRKAISARIPLSERYLQEIEEFQYNFPAATEPTIEKNSSVDEKARASESKFSEPEISIPRFYPKSLALEKAISWQKENKIKYKFLRNNAQKFSDYYIILTLLEFSALKIEGFNDFNEKPRTLLEIANVSKVLFDISGIQKYGKNIKTLHTQLWLLQW